MHTRLALLAAALFASGCATTLSTMDTPRTTPPGHVQMNVAYGLHLPAGPIGKVFSTGEEVGKKLANHEDLAPADAESLYEAALAWAIMPPQAVWETSVRTGILDNWDVGLRYSSTALRLDTKLRFFKDGDELTRIQQASIGLGASKYLFSNTVFDLLDYVQLDDFSRWDVEVPLLYSFEYRRSFVLYFGAKYVYSRFSLDENLYELQQAVAEYADADPITDRISSNMHFFGSVFGLGGGWKHVYLFTELSWGYTYCRPRVYSFLTNDLKERNLGGLTLYPAIGLVVRI
jgi:hypothetical protein